MRSHDPTNPHDAWPAWLTLPSEQLRSRVAGVTAAQWRDVAAASRTHQLAPMLHLRLREGGCLDLLPDDAAAALAALHADARLAALGWQRALRVVLPALAAAGIEPTPYKGAALAYFVYPDPAARPMSDVDFWIDDAQMPAACAALEALGFERKDNPDRPLALQRTYDGEVPYRGRRLGIPLVELHWGVFPGEWLRVAADVDRGAVRERLVPGTLFDAPVRMLAAEDHLIQIAVHAAVTHVYSQNPLRSMVDVALLAAGGVEWDAIVRRAREWRLAPIVGHALALAADLFERPMLRDVAHALAPPRRIERLGRFVDAQSILRGELLDGSARKWLYLTAAVDRDRDRLRLLSHSVWPARDWLHARYGQHGVRVRGRHLLRAVTGRF